MFLLTLLTTLFTFQPVSTETPQEVQNEMDYYACFSTYDPQGCIDNLDSN